MNQLQKTGKIILYILSFIPLVWLVVCYLFLVLSTLKLGHLPVPSLNDPKYLGFYFLYMLSMLGLLLSFYGLILMLVLVPFALWLKLFSKRLVIVMLASLALYLGQLFFDPFDLIYWLLD